MEKTQKKPTESILEECVLCGKITIYPKDMPIDYRMYYVEGAGQLCNGCYDKVYNVKTEK